MKIERFTRAEEQLELLKSTGFEQGRLEKRVSAARPPSGDALPTSEPGDNQRLKLELGDKKYPGWLEAQSRLERAAAPMQEPFRDAMASMSSAERGAWGERTLMSEVNRLEHDVLLEHEKPTTPGYDCVSWDGRELHVWEVKNYSATETGKARRAYDLGALDEKKRLRNVKQFLDPKKLPLDDSKRSAIAQAIQQNRVQWHIRAGPDTDFPFVSLDRLGWESVEAHQYSYKDMLRNL